jgi:hypothetical protein
LFIIHTIIYGCLAAGWHQRLSSRWRRSYSRFLAESKLILQPKSK